MKTIVIFLLSYFAVNNLIQCQVNPNYHYVEGHYRSDGTYVRGYYKTDSNATNKDNYTTILNANPWTGKPGFIEPDRDLVSDVEDNEESEFLSKYYNRAVELNDKGAYFESINLCKALIYRYKKPFHSLELLGWNYIAIGNYNKARESFENIYQNINQASYISSQLYLSYILNNEDEKAKSLLKTIAANAEYLDKFKKDLRDNIRRLDLNFGIPSIKVLQLIIDNENLYVGQPLLYAMYQCSNCEIKFINERMVFIGKRIHKKMFVLDAKTGLVKLCEIQCNRKYKDLMQALLLGFKYDYKGVINVPILRKVGDDRNNFTLGEIYIKDKYAIVIYDLDLDGEVNKEYFTIQFRM